MRELVLLLAAALNATVPLPLPLAPLVTVSQSCCCSRRSTRIRPATSRLSNLCRRLPATEPLVDDERKRAPEPGCVTLKLCPAIVIVPVRERCCCWPPR